MTLDDNDRLTYQLYTASKNPRIKTVRNRSWIITTLAFLFLAYLFFDLGNQALGYYFLTFALLSLTLYPLYSRWRYKRHFKKSVQEAGSGVDEEYMVEIADEAVMTKSATAETKFSISEIVEINEIQDFYFIKVRGGMSLIISKSKSAPEELEKIKMGLKALVDKRGVKHNMELNWRWK